MHRIGVLSYQGGFQRHLERLRGLGVVAVGVRDLETLRSVNALVIPGGESTTIGMLMERFGLLAAVTERIDAGFPVFGTCAGAILLAKHIEGSDQIRIGRMDITVARNAYGRQVESFEAEVAAPAERSETIPGVATFHGVFIRAPQITAVGPGVDVLLTFEGLPVLVRSGNLLAGTFHPELTVDDRIHEYFVTIVANA